MLRALRTLQHALGARLVFDQVGDPPPLRRPLALATPDRSPGSGKQARLLRRFRGSGVASVLQTPGERSMNQIAVTHLPLSTLHLSKTNMNF